MLDLKFAYSTNGPGIVEHDYINGPRQRAHDVSIARRSLAPRPPSARGSRPGRSAAPGSVLPRGQRAHPATTRTSRSTAPTEAILKGERARAADARDGHRQDHRRVPDLLEAVVGRLEPHGRDPQAAHPLPGGSQHPRRRPEGQDLRPVRRRRHKIEGRGEQEPRDVLRHLPGHRGGRATPGPLPRLPARLLRPHRRRRVPPRSARATRAAGGRSSTTSSRPTSSA